MDCGDVEKELAGLALGCLGGPIEKAVREHVAGCSSCRAKLEALRCAAGAVSMMRAPSVPAGFSERLNVRLSSLRNSPAAGFAIRGWLGRVFPGRLVWAAAAAGVLLAVFVSIGHHKVSGPTEDSSSYALIIAVDGDSGGYDGCSMSDCDKI